MRFTIRAVFAAWLIITGFSNGARASLPDAPVTQLDAVDLFETASQAALAGRVEDAITLYTALAEDPDAEVRAEARFRKAQLLVSLGRNREAATTYRRLLDEKPNAANVRLELAQLLVKMGNETGALRELRQARATGLPPDVEALTVQFARALRSPKRLGGAVDVALAPDTNINRATQLRTLDTVIAPLDLSPDARQTSGVGVKLFTQAFAKQRLVEGLDLVLRGNSLASLYRESRFNDISGSLLTGVEWRVGRDRLTGGVNIAKRWFGGQSLSDSESLSLDWLRPLGRQAQLSASISAGQVRFQRNEFQNGNVFDASVAVERALSARAGVAFGIAATRQTAVDKSNAFATFGPTASAWLQTGQTTYFIATTSRRLIGDARNFLFLKKRREWFTTLRVGGTFRKFSVAGLSPTIRLGLERNRSSVALFDYRRTFAEFGVTRNF